MYIRFIELSFLLHFFSEFKLNNYHNAWYTVPCTMLVACTFSLARARHQSWWMEGESRWNGNCTELLGLPLYLILTAFAPEGVFIVLGSKSRWTAYDKLVLRTSFIPNSHWITILWVDQYEKLGENISMRSFYLHSPLYYTTTLIQKISTMQTFSSSLIHLLVIGLLCISVSTHMYW